MKSNAIRTAFVALVLVVQLTAPVAQATHEDPEVRHWKAPLQADASWDADGMVIGAADNATEALDTETDWDKPETPAPPAGAYLQAYEVNKDPEDPDFRDLNHSFVEQDLAMYWQVELEYSRSSSDTATITVSWDPSDFADVPEIEGETLDVIATLPDGSTVDMRETDSLELTVDDGEGTVELLISAADEDFFLAEAGDTVTTSDLPDPLQEVSLTMAERCEGCTLAASVSDSAPGDVPDLPSDLDAQVFATLEIQDEDGNELDGKVASGTATFTRSQSDVDDPDNVVMAHFADDEWSELDTTLASDSEADPLVFDAQLPSFSLFAISVRDTTTSPGGGGGPGGGGTDVVTVQASVVSTSDGGDLALAECEADANIPDGTTAVEIEAPQECGVTLTRCGTSGSGDLTAEIKSWDNQPPSAPDAELSGVNDPLYAEDWLNATSGDVETTGCELTFSLPSEAAEDHDQEQLFVAHGTEDGWVPLSPTSVEETEETLEANVSVDGLSPFGVLFDEAGPTITDLSPSADTIVETEVTEISASWSDNRGIDPATATVMLDGEQRTVDADADGFTLSLEDALTTGEHTVTVEVQDDSGLVAEESWSFEIVIPEELEPAGTDPLDEIIAQLEEHPDRELSNLLRERPALVLRARECTDAEGLYTDLVSDTLEELDRIMEAREQLDDPTVGPDMGDILDEIRGGSPQVGDVLDALDQRRDVLSDAPEPVEALSPVCVGLSEDLDRYLENPSDGNAEAVRDSFEEAIPAYREAADAFDARADVVESTQQDVLGVEDELANPLTQLAESGGEDVDLAASSETMDEDEENLSTQSSDMEGDVETMSAATAGGGIAGIVWTMVGVVALAAILGLAYVYRDEISDRLQ